MISTLPDKWCPNFQAYSAEYEADKIYLGRGNSLPRKSFISMELIFQNMTEQKEFFDWWKKETQHGAKEFYAKVPIYGKGDFYLLAQDGALRQTIEPKISVSGRMLLVRNRTKDNNLPPTTSDIFYTFKEGSKNNYIKLIGIDLNGDKLIYNMITSPQHGTTVVNDGGVVQYTPTKGYVGADSFQYSANDGLHTSSPSLVSLTMEARGKDFFKVQDITSGKSVQFIDKDGKQITVKKKV